MHTNTRYYPAVFLSTGPHESLSNFALMTGSSCALRLVQDGVALVNKLNSDSSPNTS